MKITSALAGLALIALPFAASAITIDIDTVSGVWIAYEADNGTPSAGPTGIGSSTLTWGEELNDQDKQSSYVFEGNAPSGPHNAGDVFNLGDFTHNNFTIRLPSITGATLKVTITGTADGDTEDVAFNLTSVFDFTHHETPNEPGPCELGGDTPCPDLVEVDTNVANSTTITVDGEEYLFDVTGFLFNGEMLESFLTEESQANTATLQARFVKAKLVDVPAPPVLLLLLSGLGMLGFAAYHRRRRA